MKYAPHNWTYVSGLVSALWERFTGQREILALLEAASAEERATALRAGLLSSDLPATGDLVDQIDAAFVAFVKRIAAVCPEPILADLFLGAHGWQAFRAYAKAAIMETSATGTGRVAGESCFDDCWRGVAEDAAARPFVEAAKTIQEGGPIAGDPAGRVDAVSDAYEIAALLQAAIELKSVALAEWIQTFVNLQAVLVLIRARRQGWDAAERLSLFREAGLDHPGLDDIATGPEAEWPSALDRLGLPGAEKAFSDPEPAVLLARMIDDRMTKLTSDASGIPFGVERVFAFLWALKTEAANLRQVLSGVAYGVPKERVAAEIRMV